MSTLLLLYFYFVATAGCGQVLKKVILLSPLHHVCVRLKMMAKYEKEKEKLLAKEAVYARKKKEQVSE